MDLLCNEKEMFKDQPHIESQPMQVMHMEPQINTACADPTFLSERCLENLLKSEETHPTLNFYDNPQCEIKPRMRQIVAEWMMEVSLLNLFFVFLLVLRRMRLIFFSLLINFNLFRLLFELNLINTVHKSLIMQSFLFANLFIIFCCFHLFCSFPFFFLLLCLPFHLFKLELESLTSSVFYSIFTHDHTTNEKKNERFLYCNNKNATHTVMESAHIFDHLKYFAIVTQPSSYGDNERKSKIFFFCFFFFYFPIFGEFVAEFSSFWCVFVVVN